MPQEKLPNFMHFLLSPKTKLKATNCFQEWFVQVGGGREDRIISFFSQTATFFDRTSTVQSRH